MTTIQCLDLLKWALTLPIWVHSAIVATIDGAQYTISEASVRTNLQLVDDGGLSNLPDPEIYAGLTHIGAAEDQGERPAEPANQPPILAPISSPVNVPNPPIIAPTTTSPPRKGPFNSNNTALLPLVSKFMQKTTSLESELKDTRKTLGTAIITLVGRVKNLEGALKKRKRKLIIFDSDDDAERLKDEGLDGAAERLHAQEQAELERQQEELLWQDELLACQLYQDFDIPAQQKKRHQEVQAAVMHYTDDGWITIMGKIQANEELSRTLIDDELLRNAEKQEILMLKHKMCLKYASDEEDDSDCDTLVPFYAVVDWELLPTGLGTINVIYRKDNSLKYFTSLREILHLVTREDLMTI
ncbi:hypothetical protein Tco_0590779 [Tanacetum coccineum]